MIQIKPLVRGLTLTLSLHSREALAVTIVVEAVDVDDALIVVALAVRDVQHAIAYALL